MTRQHSLLDRLILSFDNGLKTLSGQAESTGVSNPAKDIPESPLTADERKKAAAFMRINHAGEICAQALYHGQALVSASPHIQAKMHEAAQEEGDHLHWCHARIMELNSHTSYLNPMWYTGSFAIGMIAGMIGDEWSLGFIAETETQVINHLQNHLEHLPENDKRSARILQQMQQDEAKHRAQALQEGGRELPFFVKRIMGCVAKVMVKTAYWI